MKKILLSVLIIGLVLNIVKVSAETCNPDKISIESISIEEKNSNTKELEEVTSTGKNIKLNLSMNEIGDNITYKMKIKNDSREDYQLGENTFNTETDYIDYSIETEDKDNIIKAQTTEIAYLRVEYKNEIPSELIADDVFKENKKITLNASDNGINNPNTKRNIIILSLIILLITSTVFISIKDKKYLKPMILIIGITLPVITFALCETNIGIDLQLKIEKPCVSFNDESSWEDIIGSVKNSSTKCMNVGDTKTIDLGNLGTHTVRIANKSTPSECSQENFSQTACGFVVEFADIINTHRMNPYSQGGSVDGDGNKGGWEHSEMRTYINNDIYNILPSELKTGIIDTKVISGYGGSIDSENFTTTDKLYLLSTHEVWEDVDGDLNNGISFFDTGYNNTKQLDYYSNLGVTTSNYSGAIKQNNESTYDWWLRSSKNRGQGFLGVHSDGTCYRYTSSGDTVWVSPAFRIG